MAEEIASPNEVLEIVLGEVIHNKPIRDRAAKFLSAHSEKHLLDIQ